MTIKLAFLKRRAQRKLQAGFCLGLIFLAAFTPVQARVTRTVVGETKALPLGVDGLAYEQIAGRAFGKLDPQALGKRIIQDIELATSTDHKTDGSGFASNAPPPILQMLPMRAPIVDADANQKGSMIPFAKAAQAAMVQGFLLETDAQALIKAADASAVLR